MTRRRILRRHPPPVPAPPPVPPEPTVLRVRDPGDVLGVVPYLLGFHPTESLVAAFVRDRRVQVTARLDLAALADLGAVIDQLEVVAARVETRDVVLVGYSADEGLRDLMRDLALLLPFDLLDVLAVSGDRWWSVCCDAGCCPVDGRPYDVAGHPLAAEAVLAGIAATASRDEIAALADGPPAVDHDRLAAATRPVADSVSRLSDRRRRRRMEQLVVAALAAGGPTETEALELAVLAREIAVRDVAWALLERVSADAHVALWCRVVAVAVPPYAAAPLGLLAMAAWVNGNGALLNCCIDRLEAVAPEYSMLALCKEISDRAVPPSFFDVLMSERWSEVG